MSWLNLQEILPSLEGAKSVRDLLTDEVKEIYQAETNPEQRAMIYADLRTIASKARITKLFDAAFNAFKKSVEDQEKAAAAYEKEKQRAAKIDNFVSIDTVAAELRELGISVRYNQLLKEIEVKGLPFYYSKENATNVLPVFMRDHMKACGYDGATQLHIDGCLNCIADRNRYNPFKEYLEVGTWDGTDRFHEIYRILGVLDSRYQMYIRKWFIQCVALGLNDDEDAPVYAEGVLVLQGEQGLAKTSFFRMMTPFPRWFVEGVVIDMRDKDSILKALRGLIAELGELDSTIKKEQSSLKAFITSPEDRIRLPYARTETRMLRRTSFCGTVNPKEYLKDESGSRRFWTIPVTNIDKHALFALSRGWIDQLWYQVYQMYLENPNGFRLTDTERKDLEAENRAFEKLLKYELEIGELLDYSLPVNRWEWWRAAEISKEYFDGRADAGQIGRALNKISSNLADMYHIDPDEIVRGIAAKRVEYALPLQHSGEAFHDSGVDAGENDVL